MDRAAPVDPQEFSPVENDPPLRGWRRAHIVPADGLGAVRRALLLALFAWLPIAFWAAANGRLSSMPSEESLLAHYGVHVRCLIVIPCLILGEEMLHRVGKHISWQFGTSGLIPAELRSEFGVVVGSVARLRDAFLPWMVALAVAILVSIADGPSAQDDRIAWAVGPDGLVGFGGLWYGYVVRPIVVALLLGWIWRLVLLTVLMWRLGRLPLALVATHPDRTGGIGFVQTIPRGFAPVTFASASILVGRWAHEVVYHGALLAQFQPAAITYAIVWSLALLMPLFALCPILFTTRKQALPMYAALVGEQARLVHRRWIERKHIEDEDVLERGGIGVMADAATVYAQVKSMRVVPIGRRTLLAIVAPMAIPFLVLVMLKFPLKSILLTLVKVLA